MATVPRPRALPIVLGAIDESRAVEFVIGRRALAARLWSTLERNHVRVTGERHMGKTWLLKLAAARPPNWALPAYTDATGCATPEQLVTRMCAALHRVKLVSPDWFARVERWQSLLESSPRDNPSKESLAPWSRVFRAALVQAVRNAGNRRPVVIFDEIDGALATWDDNIVDDLYQCVTRICGESDAVRFVVCGPRLGGRTSSNGGSGFVSFSVPPLARGDAQYLAACLLLGEQVACSDLEAVAEAVADLSRENPYLIRTTVDWMVRFGNGAWTPERVREVPTALWFEVTDDNAGPRFSDEMMPGGQPDDSVIKRNRPMDRTANGPTLLDAAAAPQVSDRAASRNVLSLPPAFQLLGAPKRRSPASPREPAGKSFPLGKVTALRDDSLALPLRRIADEVLNGIEQSLRKGEPHRVAIAGPMGSGKSHVLRHLAKALRGSLRDTGVQLIELPNASSPPLANDLPAECLHAAGASREHVAALKPENASTVEGKKAAALLRALTNGSRTIVLADLNGDLWHNQRKGAMPDLLAFLEHAPEISLVHTGRVSLSKRSVLAPLARHRIHVHYLQPFSIEESLAFVRTRLRAVLGETGAAAWLGESALPALRTLHALSGGNVGWLNAVVDAIGPKSGFKIRHAVEAAAQRALESGLKDVLDRLPETAKAVLNTLVCEDGGPLSADAVAKRAGIARGAALMELDRLVQADLVLRCEGTPEPMFEVRDAALEGALARYAGDPGRIAHTVAFVRDWYEAGAEASRSHSRCVPPAAYSYVSLADGEDGPANQPSAFVAFAPGTPCASARVALAEARRHLLELDEPGPAGASRTEEAWVARGNALAAQGRFSDALAAYEAGALARLRGGEGPETGFMALLNKAYTLDVMGRGGDAIEIYNELARGHAGTEREAIALVNKAGALIALERHREAASACNEVFAVVGTVEDPFLSELTASAKFNLGCALHALGRDSEALAAYEDAVRLCASSSCGHTQKLAADALNNTAAVHSAQANYLDSIDACDTALRLHPAHVRAHIQRICAYLKLDLAGEALTALADALRLISNDGCERRLLVAEVLDCASSDGALTQMVAAALGHDPRLLPAGMVLWLRRTAWSVAGKSRHAAHMYYVLRQTLESSPPARLALELLRELAVRSGAAITAHRRVPPIVRHLLDECTAPEPRRPDQSCHKTLGGPWQI